MVAKISIGSSLYGALAYNAQKVNADEGKLLATNRSLIFVITISMLLI